MRRIVWVSLADGCSRFALTALALKPGDVRRYGPPPFIATHRGDQPSRGRPDL